jgi:hypothetical protein
MIMFVFLKMIVPWGCSVLEVWYDHVFSCVCGAQRRNMMVCMHLQHMVICEVVYFEELCLGPTAPQRYNMMRSVNVCALACVHDDWCILRVCMFGIMASHRHCVYVCPVCA